MSKQFKEMQEYAKELHSLGEMMTASQTMMIAAQMVQNRIIEDALMTGRDHPGAIESIAISLGASPTPNSSVIESLDLIANSIDCVASYIEECKIVFESLDRVIKGSTISNE